MANRMCSEMYRHPILHTCTQFPTRWRHYSSFTVFIDFQESGSNLCADRGKIKKERNKRCTEGKMSKAAWRASKWTKVLLRASLEAYISHISSIEMKKISILWCLKLHPVWPSTYIIANSFVWVTCSHRVHTDHILPSFPKGSRDSEHSSLYFESESVVSLPVFSDLYSTIWLSAGSYQYLHTVTS